MICIRNDGSPAELAAVRRCLPGKLADAFIRRARNRLERRRRVRSLAAFACVQVWGMPRSFVQDLFDLAEAQVREDLDHAHAGLAYEARELNIDFDRLFPRRPPTEDIEPCLPP